MKKIHLAHFIYLLSITASYAAHEERTEYYVNLINTQIARAASAKPLPNNSFEYRPLKNEDIRYGTFDHIVVGSGSAGGIVASRLSEDPSKSVLLIEAGDNETDFTDIPAMARYSFPLGYGWPYKTIPQRGSCLAMANQQCDYPRGKGIGGSALINGLVYCRGSARDYDNWCERGNPTWSFKDVLPFFKKSENSKIDGDEGYHGFGGNLNVEYSRPRGVRVSMFLEANRELHKHIGDYNGRNSLRVDRGQFNTIKGRRGTTGRTFLRPFVNRKNLKILTKSYATQILISNKTAYGVRFAKDQQYFVAKSRKDIVISAGAIGTPQLLMQSGIGPKLHLENLGIYVKQNLSVGNYLKDHFGYFLNFVTNYTESQDDLAGMVRDYLHSKGPLTNAHNLFAWGLYQTNLSKIPDYPDVEIILAGNDADPRRGFSMLVIVLHPVSKGYLRLKSKDPFDYPLINPNAYTDAHDHDLETIYQGIQLALKLLTTKAFRRYATSLQPGNLPACRNYEYLSRAYWYCQIKQQSVPIHHSIGTCAMGPEPLRGAVVNHKLKVYGIKNLRVADASVMPDLNSGHTNAPAMMIGEKAAHMIRFG